MKLASFRRPLVLGVLPLFLTTAMWGAHENLAGELNDANLPETVEVIVQYRNTRTAEHHSRVAAKGRIVMHKSDGMKAGSGAAAVLIQPNPSLTPDQVMARLMRTASKNFPVSSVAVDPMTHMSYTSYYDIFTVGAGYLDIATALADKTGASGAALSPSAAYSAVNNTVPLQSVVRQNVVWGSNVLWGSNVVWGSNFVWGSSMVGCNNVVWGS